DSPAGRFPSAKITDFGLAKHLHGELAASVGDAKTESGAILGTPNYMAPEQAAGKQRQIGPAVDIYGLGAILYELLTGRPPFEGDTPLQTLQRLALEEPITPSRLQRKGPRDLETIALQCLEKDPRKRYATALALAEDLDRFLAGETVQARRASRAERTWRWCRRNPWTAGLTGTVLGLLIVLAVGSLIAAVRLKKSADER